MKFLFGIIFAICVLFFLLGLKSQKGQAPGLVEGKLKEPGTAPNSISSEEETQPERHVPPIKASKANILMAIQQTGGVITSESESYISATYMSKIFKFVDDVELRHVRGNLWHIRSASRVGYSDRGVNRKRVDLIRSELLDK